ncbi:hypothetical protein BB559_002974 [Furculomyces boomerangus]|uniref:Presequence protease, mitochondrial n=1 Tax=Furculomyces boomerangus TaxID=61424 RepID=A0A2T9YQ98_9FUNG|nr:hypothetical protein BB559_002974 [Furculomyces boomerangus]
MFVSRITISNSFPNIPLSTKLRNRIYLKSRLINMFTNLFKAGGNHALKTNRQLALKIENELHSSAKLLSRSFNTIKSKNSKIEQSVSSSIKNKIAINQKKSKLLSLPYSTIVNEKNTLESESFKIGQVINGFEVKKINEIQEFGVTTVLLVDQRTGAEWLHLKRDDNNNLFSVGFRTSVDNSTGVPHILEHTVLCGSKKYPVRDPFFKMLNRSMSTFMNAWTAHNYTQYPFSTQNLKDYENLQSVYLDAVFNPLLKEQDFLQEGWRLERDEYKNFQIKGVVYNEMKGAFSDAGSLLQTRTDHHLFPGTTYEHESGGDPAHITELTHEKLVEFHRRNYHPSNSKFFSYGNFPLGPQLEKVSKVLVNYEKSNPQTAQHIVVPFGTRSVTEEGPVEGSGDAANQTKFSISFLMNDVSDVYQTFKTQIFSSLLLEGTSAPMHQALIDSGIGPDFSANTGYNTQNKISSLTIGLQGISQDKIDSVENAIKKTLVEVYEKGFESKRIEAVIHSIELAFKHKTAHFGMSLMQMISSSWFLDIDPFVILNVESNLARLREESSKGNPFADIARKYLLNSDHSLKFTMTASSEFPNKQTTQEAKMLASMVKTLTEENMNVIDEQAEELAKVQKQVEDISCLPTLVLDDVSRNINRYAIDLSSVESVPVQWRVTATNGISYLKAINSIPNLPQNLVPYLPLFCEAITYLGTKKRQMQEIETEIDLYTGGISVTTFSSTDYDNLSISETGIRISSNCLDVNIPKMYELVSELIFETDFSNKERLRTLISASAAGIYNRIASSGHMYARSLAASTLSYESDFSNQTTGVGQALFIGQLNKHVLDSELESVIEALKQIQSYILSAENMRVAITTGSNSVDENCKHFAKMVSKYPTKTDKPSNNSTSSIVKFLPKPSRFICPLPFASNFAARSVLAVPYTHNDSTSLQVLAKILTPNFLHREIRESNGAYGGGAGYSAMSGMFSFFSYRDPNPLFSLDSFSRSIDYALTNEFSDRQLSESKLSLFKDLDGPISVSEEGTVYFNYGITDDMRQERRDQLFNVSIPDLKHVAEKYLLESKNNLRSDAVIGNSNSLSLLLMENDLDAKIQESDKKEWTTINLE